MWFRRTVAVGMNLATTAPSGNVGQHVVADLVRAGVEPRVLARRPQSVDPAWRDHVDVRVCDLGAADELSAALEGVDALFVTVPATMSPDPVAQYARFGAAITAAVTEAGAARVVLQSSVGAEKRHGVGEIDGLARVEEQLDGSGTSVVHLRCGYFFTNLLFQIDDLRAGEVNVVLPTDRAMAWVAPVDIAHVASSWLLRPDWTGRHVRGVHGPCDLSWDTALEIVSEVTGHPVRARRIDDDEMRAGLRTAGLNDSQVEAIIGMSTGLVDGFEPEQPRDATTTTPTTLTAWAYDVLRPLLQVPAP